MNVGVIDELQPPLKLSLHPLALIAVQAVPFIDGDNQPSTGIDSLSQQVQILLDQPLAGIHHQNDDVGVADGLQRFDNREFLDRFPDVLPPPYAGGIDQGVAPVVTLEINVDAIAGGTRLVVYHDPIFTEHAVDQRGLSHIGPTDDSYPDTAEIGPGPLLRVLVELSEHGIQQWLYTAAVGRCDGVDDGYAQF